MIRVKGLEKTVAGLEEVFEQVVEKTDEFLEKAADAVAEKAKQNAPVKTGRLRDSITKSKKASLIYVVEASAPYAGYVEFGTSKMAPRRYMQKAVAEVFAGLKG